MTLNIAEARVQVTAQTKGQQEIASLEQAVNTLTRQVKTFAQQAGESGAASAQFARRAQETAAETSRMSGTMRLASFELMHVGTALSDSMNAGQSPMRALTMESGRLVEALQFLAMGVETTEGAFGKFAAFMGGPWGMALMIGVNLLGSLLIAHHKAAGGAETHKAAVEDLSKALDTLYEKTKRATTSTRDETVADMQAAFAARTATVEKLKQAQAELAVQRANLAAVGINEIQGAGGGTAAGTANYIAQGQARSAQGQIEALSAKIKSLQGDADKGAAAIRGFQGQLIQSAIADKFDKTAAASDRFRNRMSELNRELRDGKITVQEFARETYKAQSTLEADKQAIKDEAKANRDAAKALRERTKAAEAFRKETAKLLDAGLAGLWKNDAALNKTFATNADTQFMSVMDQLAQNETTRTNPMMAAGIAQFNSIGEQSFQAVSDYAGKIGSLGQGAFKLWTDAMQGTETALVNFVATGKLSVKSLADSIIADLARMAIEQAVILPLTGALKHILGSADGNVFAFGNPVPHATGGIVSAPTLFPMGGGKVGSMAESGPEAIMPLKRLPSGRLGVETSGGGAGNIVVNVDATGTQVQGNKQQASQLGTALGAAVRAELLRQKRPGGILAN
ncbi:MAG: phage tail tape measure protein [Sphingomonadales bacterium]|nr:phage tail tape measure protein [Sphingomonadales bacterium]